jgi:ubiquitin C-terminal hydrolase
MHETRERVLAKLPHELKAPPEGFLRLGACLQSLCTLETLDGENAYTCDKCAAAARAQAAAAGQPPPPPKGQPALKWLQVARTPRALTLHLKRFRWVGSKVHKVDAFVRFPLLLDLSPYACADAPVEHFTYMKDRGGAPSAGAAAAHVAEAPMELYGVVQHEGSFEGGHCAPRPARA